MPQIERDVAAFGDTSNVRLSNGDAELLIPTAYGPRIMHYSLQGRSNVFAVVPPEAQVYETRLGRWHIRGGHRLWAAPENDPDSYYPDEDPIAVSIDGARITLTQPVEPHTGIEKSIVVELAARGSDVRVEHRVRNCGERPIEVAPWALSVFAGEARAIVAHPPHVPHPKALAPARPLVTWPFTRMGDRRWTWGDRFVQVRHDPGAPDAQKIGLYDREGYVVCATSELVFVKRHTPRPGPHADLGCNVEIFTNEQILEVETLGPLVRLEPGASTAHEERWSLHEARLPTGDDEDALAEALAPIVRQFANQPRP
jgi:hypothetical protein